MSLKTLDTAELAVALGRPVARVDRRPYIYRTSYPLEQLDVVLDDGTRLELVRKDLRRDALDESVRRAKPEFVHDPRREIEVYRLLAPERLGTAACYAHGDDWLLLERVDGVELYQVGEIERWQEAARWLVRLHARFAERPPASAHRLRYDAAFYRLWPERARTRWPEVESIAARYDRVVGLLTALPPTLVHGEFYASNVLVADGRVAPVDWEMAGIGPGLLDLAALTTGFGTKEQAAIVAAYGDVPGEALDACRLHLALQWLGWSPDWAPPPEHVHDWLAEAQGCAARLELLG